MHEAVQKQWLSTETGHVFIHQRLARRVDRELEGLVVLLLSLEYDSSEGVSA